MNLKKLNINFKLYSEIGKDYIGDEVKKLLIKNKINYSILRKKKITSNKKRVFIRAKRDLGKRSKNPKNLCWPTPRRPQLLS